MAFSIEILTTDVGLIPYLTAAIQPLNKVQSEFHFSLANERLMQEALDFRQSTYPNKDVYEWLKTHREKNGGNRQYLILVNSKPLERNLFGSHRAAEGLAWFTTDIFENVSTQFVFDKTRYCRYYLVRYILSFVNTGIKSHPTRVCMFDKKDYKPDIKLSYDTGRICDECNGKLRLSPLYNVEVGQAIRKLLDIVSNQYSRSLVMKGGGVKGLALVGALLELEKHFTFDTFAGTSAGGIAATLLGAGYTPNELKEILFEKNFNDFRNNIAKRIWNFFTTGAFNDGKHFRDWIDQLLKQKNDRQVSSVKMMDLKNRAILYATWVGQGLLRFDSSGERQDATAAFATKCSMSIPMFFIPEKIEGTKVYDGGLGYNFPLRTFIDDNGSSLFIGLYLTSDMKQNGNLYEDIRDIVTDADERQVVDNNIDKIVVIDPRPIKTTQFKLTEKDKKYLLQAGKVGALTYLNKFHPDIQVSTELVIQEKTILQKMRDKLNEPDDNIEEEKQ